MTSRAAVVDVIQDFSENFAKYQKLVAHNDGASLLQSLVLVEKYEIVTSHLYCLRSTLPSEDPFRRQIEEKVFDLGQALTTIRPEEKSEEPFTVRYRRAWRDNFSLFLFTAIFFLSTLVIGWQLAATDPASVSVIVPQRMLEEILDRTRWFDQLQADSFIGGFRIALNNIKVSIYCWCMGALLGIGGVCILAFNGLLPGALFGFCYLNKFDKELLGFVIGHGPLELSIIVSAAFSGLMIGRVFFMRPYKLFGTRMRMAAADSGTILVGILPWLLLAAAIEAGISPWPTISDEVKLSLGAIAACLFWIWTLAPIPTSGSKSASRSRAA